MIMPGAYYRSCEPSAPRHIGESSVSDRAEDPRSAAHAGMSRASPISSRVRRNSKPLAF